MAENPFEVELNAEEMKAIGEEQDIPTMPPTQAQESVSRGLSYEEKKARLEALKAREQELLRRKQELEEIQIDIIPANNWPPFFPLLHYDPETDLPATAIPAVYNSRNGLSCYFCSIFINLIAILSVRSLPNYPHVKNFIYAMIEGAAGLYFAFNFSYSKIYTACRNKDIPFSWTLYQFLLIGWMAYLFIGFPTSGSVGFATLLDLIAKNSPFFSKFMSMLNIIGIGFAIYFEFRTLVLAQNYQKVSGIEDQLLGAASNLAQQVVTSTAQFVASKP